MPTTITISISDEELSNADKALIKDCLGLSSEPETIAALTKLSKAAFMEYVKMFREKGLPTRADEVQQERLFYLLVHYYKIKLPTENEISSIFQLTPSQSKTLLKNTKSRYRTKINSFITASLMETLNSAGDPRENGNYEFVCTSPSTIEEMNLIVSQKGPELHPVEKIRGLASMYSCAPDTYNLLMHELG